MSKLTLELYTKDEKLTKIDSLEELFLYEAIIKHILKKKIIIIFIEGSSGEGKTMTSVALAEHLEKLFNKLTGKGVSKFDPYLQVIYTPKEYSTKIDAWTKNPYICLVVDELRFLVPKVRWYSLLNQSIAEANATLRAVKIRHCGYGGVLIYNSQDIGDISKDVRKTINLDIIVKRTSIVQGKVFTFWQDKSNVEKPVLRLKRLSFNFEGCEFKLDFFEMPMPSKEVARKVEELSVEAKSKILKKKRERILREIKRELGEIRDFAEELKQDEIFNMVKGLASWSKKKGIYFTRPNMRIICKIFDITPKEFKERFFPTFIEECKRRGLI